jgi:hypothetical protein
LKASFPPRDRARFVELRIEGCGTDHTDFGAKGQSRSTSILSGFCRGVP